LHKRVPAKSNSLKSETKCVHNENSIRLLEGLLGLLHYFGYDCFLGPAMVHKKKKAAIERGRETLSDKIQHEMYKEETIKAEVKPELTRHTKA